MRIKDKHINCNKDNKKVIKNMRMTKIIYQHKEEFHIHHWIHNYLQTQQSIQSIIMYRIKHYKLKIVKILHKQKAQLIKFDWLQLKKWV